MEIGEKIKRLLRRDEPSLDATEAAEALPGEESIMSLINLTGGTANPSSYSWSSSSRSLPSSLESLDESSQPESERGDSLALLSLLGGVPDESSRSKKRTAVVSAKLTRRSLLRPNVSPSIVLKSISDRTAWQYSQAIEPLRSD